MGLTFDEKLIKNYIAQYKDIQTYLAFVDWCEHHSTDPLTKFYASEINRRLDERANNV